MPIEDKQALKVLNLIYDAKAVQYAWAKLPTYRSDCKAERAVKRRLQEKYIKEYLNGVCNT